MCVCVCVCVCKGGCERIRERRRLANSRITTNDLSLCLSLVASGFIVDFISFPVISGFTSAAAITIAVGQVKVWHGRPWCCVGGMEGRGGTGRGTSTHTERPTHAHRETGSHKHTHTHRHTHTQTHTHTHVHIRCGSRSGGASACSVQIPTHYAPCPVAMHNNTWQHIFGLRGVRRPFTECVYDTFHKLEHTMCVCVCVCVCVLAVSRQTDRQTHRHTDRHRHTDTQTHRRKRRAHTHTHNSLTYSVLPAVFCLPVQCP